MTVCACATQDVTCELPCTQGLQFRLRRSAEDDSHANPSVCLRFALTISVAQASRPAGVVPMQGFSLLSISLRIHFSGLYVTNTASPSGCRVPDVCCTSCMQFAALP